MSRYANGQPIYLSTTVKDRTGTLVNAGAISITVQKPDLTQQVYSSPTNDSTGNYHQDIPATDLTQNGHYQYVWTATGAGAGVSRGDFDVFDPFEPAILPLQDAKDAANIPQGTTTYDNELQVMVDITTQLLETLTGGPAYNRAITERILATNNYTALVVRQRPLVSVTSVTDAASGSVIPITDIELDTNAGIVRRKRLLPWFGWGTNGYTVVYVAGWGTIIPPAFNLAARMILQDLWTTQMGPGTRPVGGLGGWMGTPGPQFAIPPRALEVMRPYMTEVYV